LREERMGVRFVAYRGKGSLRTGRELFLKPAIGGEWHFLSLGWRPLRLKRNKWTVSLFTEGTGKSLPEEIPIRGGDFLGRLRGLSSRRGASHTRGENLQTSTA